MWIKTIVRFISQITKAVSWNKFPSTNPSFQTSSFTYLPSLHVLCANYTMHNQRMNRAQRMREQPVHEQLAELSNHWIVNCESVIRQLKQAAHAQADLAQVAHDSRTSCASCSLHIIRLTYRYTILL